MTKQLEFNNISNEEFAKLTTALANSTTVMIQGQAFNGKNPHTMGEIEYYFSKIKTPNTNSSALLIATQTSVDKEYFPHTQTKDFPIKNREQLQRLYADFAKDVKSCLDGKHLPITIELLRQLDGIYTNLHCGSTPMQPAPTMPSRPSSRIRT